MDHVREALRQVWEGMDFEGPERLVRSVSPEQAERAMPGFPYSIGTNVAHADHWNRIWLARLTGGKRPRAFPDFPAVTASEWPEVRARFLETLRQTMELAGKDPIPHFMKSDEAAARALLQIAVHTAYHLGQIKLMKRVMRAGADETGEANGSPTSGVGSGV